MPGEEGGPEGSDLAGDVARAVALRPRVVDDNAAVVAAAAVDRYLPADSSLALVVAASEKGCTHGPAFNALIIDHDIVTNDDW